MCAAVRTTVVSFVCTWTLVAAIPQRSTGSASSIQPPTGRWWQMLRDLVQVGTGVDEGAERHVPGDPAEAVEPGEPTGHRRVPTPRRRTTAQAAP